jgi:WD repeat-containing protein 48
MLWVSVCLIGICKLTLDPAGKVLAAGTPERVVRLWDPRIGDKSVGKLIGHTDCVRSVILSEDGRHVSVAESTQFLS